MLESVVQPPGSVDGIIAAKITTVRRRDRNRVPKGKQRRCRIEPRNRGFMLVFGIDNLIFTTNSTFAIRPVAIPSVFFRKSLDYFAFLT
jgi:hypothetical protein